MAKQSLGNVVSLKQTANEVAIGYLLAEAGEVLGGYSVLADELQADAQSVMEKAIKDALKKGLQVEHLKAKAPAYCAFVDAMQYARTANGAKPISDATRDNYLSRIRKFVAARGAIAFDVFGNLAAKEQKKAREIADVKGLPKDTAPAASDSSEDTGEHEDASNDSNIGGIKVQLGAPCLAAYLAAWIDLNGQSSALSKITVMTKDLLQQINVAIGVK